MTIAVELSEDQAAALQAQAQSHGLTLSQWIARLAVPSPVPSPADSTSEAPIWEVIGGSMQHVSRVDLAQLPKDGASQIDHYLYGHPKTDQPATDR